MEEVSTGADSTDASKSIPWTSPESNRRRAVIGAVFIILVLAAAGYAIFNDRRSFAAAFERMGPGALLLSLACGLAAVAIALPTWRQILDGLGVTFPWRESARIFYVSQLGKYIPGAIWPLVMQMEAGHARGINRRTMISANLFMIVITCCIGIAVACALLPFYDLHALAHYWWALLALPILIAMLHPRALPALLDLVFALLRRPPLSERLDPQAELRACGWVLLSWVAYGAEVAVLVSALRPPSLSVFVLSTGAIALALPLGILFIPAPAGAGIREVVLTLVLATVLSTGQALAVAVASRALLIICELTFAALGAIVGRQPSRRRG